VLPNKVEYLNLTSYGDTPSDMMFSIGRQSNNQLQGNGSLVLQPVVGGHYAAQGSINEVPALFLVDTGAYGVMVPHAFAMHAGIKGCKKQAMATASGMTNFCVGMADKLVVGQFVFKNVEVAYSKKAPTDMFLLGMSILSQLKMVQQDGRMVLSRK
jgi:aspartyl protease family protein